MRVFTNTEGGRGQERANISMFDTLQHSPFTQLFTDKISLLFLPFYRSEAVLAASTVDGGVLSCEYYLNPSRRK